MKGFSLLSSQRISELENEIDLLVKLHYLHAGKLELLSLLWEFFKGFSASKLNCFISLWEMKPSAILHLNIGTW